MKRKACMLATLLAIVISIANVGFVIKDAFFYSLDNLPTGTAIPYSYDEKGNPDNYRWSDQKYVFDQDKGGYHILFYAVPETRHNPSGIRAEVCRDSTGERRTIYWQIGETANMISWEDYTVVTINGITIDFTQNYYDCREYPDYKYVQPEAVD